MSNFWFRCHNDIINDPKIRVLAFEDRWHYVAICCLKSSGELDKEYPDDLREMFIANQLGISVPDLDNVKKRLTKVLLIDDQWQPNGWDKRQFLSDQKDPTAAARQKKHREKKKLEECYGSVTPALRPEIELEKDLDLDLDKKLPEKPKKKTFILPTHINSEIWKLFVEHRQKLRAPMTDHAKELMISKLSKLNGNPNEILNQSIEAGWKGVFELKGDNNGSGSNQNSTQKFNNEIDRLAQEAIDRGETF